MRRDGDGGDAEFGGFLPQECAEVADDRLGGALVEFALGGNVLAGRSEGATSGRLHIDGAKAFDGDHRGLGFQQDFADLATHIEDQCRVRMDHGPQNMNILRQIGHNLLKNETTLKVGIQGKRLNAGWDEDYLRKVLLG